MGERWNSWPHNKYSKLAHKQAWLSEIGDSLGIVQMVYAQTRICSKKNYEYLRLWDKNGSKEPANKKKKKTCQHVALTVSVDLK